MHSLAWSLWNNDLSTSAWIYATEYGGKYLICYLHLIYFLENQLEKSDADASADARELQFQLQLWQKASAL